MRDPTQVGDSKAGLVPGLLGHERIIEKRSHPENGSTPATQRRFHVLPAAEHDLGMPTPRAAFAAILQVLLETARRLGNMEFPWRRHVLVVASDLRDASDVVSRQRPGLCCC